MNHSEENALDNLGNRLFYTESRNEVKGYIQGLVDCCQDEDFRDLMLAFEDAVYEEKWRIYESILNT